LRGFHEDATRKTGPVKFQLINVCLCVCPSQFVVLSERLNGSSWFRHKGFPPTYHTQHFKELRVSPKIRILPFRAFPQTPDLQNFDTGCPSHMISTVRQRGRRLVYFTVRPPCSTTAKSTRPLENTRAPAALPRRSRRQIAFQDYASRPANWLRIRLPVGPTRACTDSAVKWSST